MAVNEIAPSRVLGLIGLAMINIVFAIFNLPYGWWTIFISMIILLMVSSAKATMWFRQTD